jgi:K+/H+ antiporter YhaU regulatory subunit KhtT
MRFKALKFGKLKEEPEDEVIELDKETANQLSEMQEHISNKTKNLEKTKQQLQELTSAFDNHDEEEVPKPHGPIGELSVEPEDKMMDIDLDVPGDEDLFEATGEEINVVEINAKDTTQETTEKAEEDTEETSDAKKKKDEDESFSNLFSSEEEEVNPLASLINSLPEVSAQELLDDLEEIKDIIKDNNQTS